MLPASSGWGFTCLYGPVSGMWQTDVDPQSEDCPNILSYLVQSSNSNISENIGKKTGIL